MVESRTAGASWFQRWHRRIEGLLAMISLGLLVTPTVAILQGKPDQYRNEHWQMIALAGAMLGGSLGALVTSMRIRWALLGLSFGLLAVSLWLIL